MLAQTPKQNFALGSKNAKTCVTPNAKHKICVTPNAKPQREPMNIGCIGSPTQNVCVGHACRPTFHVVCAHFIRVGYPTGTQFAVEYGLKGGGGKQFVIARPPFEFLLIRS